MVFTTSLLYDLMKIILKRRDTNILFIRLFNQKERSNVFIVKQRDKTSIEEACCRLIKEPL